MQLCELAVRKVSLHSKTILIFDQLSFTLPRPSPRPSYLGAYLFGKPSRQLPHLAADAAEDDADDFEVDYPVPSCPIVGHIQTVIAYCRFTNCSSYVVT